ncbi:hypothetical protein PIIN_08501 [Serendipita indica DSM 11827]|uniref:Uncharacterized protein n=1 Tax=Serendipita indica (strain DSM 11827) TaxID=1109443 RepID=G4TTA6_SERID|nr:hypothetical protein PIIN_08501 [Serendipita indica DSM 11827]
MIPILILDTPHLATNPHPHPHFLIQPIVLFGRRPKPSSIPILVVCTLPPLAFEIPVPVTAAAPFGLIKKKDLGGFWMPSVWSFACWQWSNDSWDLSDPQESKAHEQGLQMLTGMCVRPINWPSPRCSLTNLNLDYLDCVLSQLIVLSNLDTYSFPRPFPRPSTA